MYLWCKLNQITHLELLKRLPSPYREQAIENNTQAESWLNLQGTTLKAALAQSFKWDGTPQGRDYWVDIYERIEAGEFEPQDPSVTLPREDWEVLLSYLESKNSQLANRFFEAIQSQLNPKQ